MPRIDIWGAKPGKGDIWRAAGEAATEQGAGFRGVMGHATIHITTATINVARGNINIGGRGGGGLGGGGGGHGGGVFGEGPFGGRGAMAGLANAGLAAFGLTTLVQFGVAIIRDIITMPQLMGKLWQGALAAASPYINLKTAAFELGRAGGFSGQGMMRSIFPGSYATPQWMESLGVTPEDVMKSLSGLGVVPRSQGQATGAAQISRLFGLSPAFAGMQSGTVEGLGRQGIAFGQTGFSGLQGYLGVFANVMDDAVARGLDRAKVLSSIQDILEIMAKGSPALNVQSTADFFMKMGAIGTPGTRTGATQAQILGGVSGMMQAPLSSPLSALVTMNVSRRFNNFRSEQDVRNFLHLGPGEIPPGMSQETWKDRVSRITALAQSNPALAATLAMSLASGSTAAQMDVARAARSIAPRGLEAFAISGALNIPLEAAQSLSQSLDMPGVVPSGASTSAVEGMKAGAGLTPLATAFSNSVDYATILKNAGVPDDIARDLIDAGRRNGVSPLVLAAIAQKESGFNPNAVNVNRRAGARGGVSSTDYGLMQINEKNLASFGLTPTTALNPALSAEAGAEFIARSGGNISAYNSGDPNYAADIARRVGNISGNLPGDVFSAQARAAQSDITGGAAAMATFVPAVGAANTALEGLVAAAQRVITAFSAIGSAGQSAPAKRYSRLGMAPAQ